MRILGLHFCWSMFSTYYLISKPYPKGQSARTIKHSSLLAEQIISHGKMLDVVEAYPQHVAEICGAKKLKIETCLSRRTLLRQGKLVRRRKQIIDPDPTSPQISRKTCELHSVDVNFYVQKYYSRQRKCESPLNTVKIKVSGKRASLHRTILFSALQFCLADI